MTPDAHRVMALHSPGLWINSPRTGAKFHIKPRGGFGVKRQHVVIGVAAQGHGDRNLFILTEVVGGTNFIQAAGLDHKVQ